MSVKTLYRNHLERMLSTGRRDGRLGHKSVMSLGSQLELIGAMMRASQEMAEAEFATLDEIDREFYLDTIGGE